MPVKHSEQQTHKAFSTRSDIPATTRLECCQLLNITLAGTLDLWTQLKQAHWNVKGQRFLSIAFVV